MLIPRQMSPQATKYKETMSPTTSLQIEGGKVEAVTDLFSQVPKSLQIVTVALKFKNACSLEGKL